MPARGNKSSVEPRSERKLIHVVDDDVSVLELISACAENAGYPTQAFKNPIEAYSAFCWANPKPSLLIVDYDMPGMNGLELLRRCRSLSPGLKAICITGVLSIDILEESEVKPDLMLPKPFAFRELVEGVRELLGRT